LTSNETSGIVKLLVSFNDDDDYKGKDVPQGTGQSQCFFFQANIFQILSTQKYISKMNDTVK
jgi:hypothetical protein